MLHHITPELLQKFFHWFSYSSLSHQIHTAFTFLRHHFHDLTPLLKHVHRFSSVPRINSSLFLLCVCVFTSQSFWYQIKLSPFLFSNFLINVFFSLLLSTLICLKVRVACYSYHRILNMLCCICTMMLIKYLLTWNKYSGNSSWQIAF